ncbi:hypothetical protein BCR32DRAFT_131528 [Anaeromyces robustus]|uniref:Tubby C-terminal domain-containing protein n=1 Tax=Anaeromyces robustus TaxID=1754192 RepID=A0A1Y1XF21_9FUNG|nr:hypothetical protein BCR32DRAFT_131528 [Anaeromyces robustus]|eukprot:ORX84282.1 hypothetical protein BCR32DRAFT_131528 [Anaeromyces robustus]
MTAYTRNNEICAIDSKYISEKKSTFYLISDGVLRKKFYIQDKNNKTIFKSSYKSFFNYGVLKDPNNDEIFFKYDNIHHFTKPNDLIINCLENGKEINPSIICSIKRKRSLKHFKYNVIFYNKATGNYELLEIICSPNYKNCSIYHGEKNNNGQLICKFNIIKNFMKFNFKIEIASKIDVMFMLILVNDIFYIIQGRKASAAAAAAA